MNLEKLDQVMATMPHEDYEAANTLARDLRKLVPLRTSFALIYHDGKKAGREAKREVMAKVYQERDELRKTVTQLEEHNQFLREALQCAVNLADAIRNENKSLKEAIAARTEQPTQGDITGEESNEPE